MTKLQSEVYKYIKQTIQIKGLPPTYTEITDDCGLIAESQAYTIVKRLCELDYLVKGNKKEIRNIRLTPEKLQ
jgi:repressor LexA